ncbi:2,3-bisphosphoglycerate-dependent phosphoglycerate mutase [Tessaracoccus flavus]|uniref:2,3-bisphosphoglycerate-dependent phosphoglycerate mutase n=1 Tax=Tessaracoccus flavus TaxID=1610493 RepID=A0A1Q2CGT4_9ACTN|nr:2,3-diphosphoglycerate-dependent phosphoglycerate mutase [Tessaracoccus flavus]AQP45313.1 hypothetical protein RPIT_11325 [Tessaracoccus flavus]
MGTLMLLRHGESTYNAQQVFTGLLDAGLTPAGEAQVAVAADLIRGADLRPDVVWQSTMLRSLRTTELLLSHLGLEDFDPRSTWRLVERAYGVLTDLPKREARHRYGDHAFHEWRRTINGRPPHATAEQVASWTDPAPVAERGSLPAGVGESLADVIERVRPWWDEDVHPDLVAGRTVFVVAHGNTLRALADVVLGLSDREVEDLNIPAGHPLTLEFSDGRPGSPRYLDPDVAQRAAAAVAAEGGT